MKCSFSRVLKILSVFSSPFTLTVCFINRIRTTFTLTGSGHSAGLRVSSGKTLSAVKCCKRLSSEYPKAIVCSNLDIHGLDVPVIPFTDYDMLHDLDNKEKGIIFLIDEIQLLWNSLESKNIPVSEIAEFCQMRKSRRVLLGTTQVYGRVAKPIREQLKYAILCKSYFKYLQVNRIIDPNGENVQGEKDGQLDGELIRTEWFFHRPEDYLAYNTYTKIKRANRK